MRREITQIKTKERYMNIALKLAEKGQGKVFPNPIVGAVLVKNGKIISQGYHRYFGGPHAEIEAINNAKQPVAGSALYVTLEPCDHYGKTPPCTKAIIKAGIKNVYIAALDPNPLVAGKGVKKLRQHNIPVIAGIAAAKAVLLNREYIHYIKYKRPYVIIKWAMSLDGKIATRIGDSKWISNEQARKYAHALRASVGAIIIGINTVLKDDPNLTVRGIPGAKNPVRIILDHHLRIPLESKILDRRAKTIVVCGKHGSLFRARQLMKKGVEVLKVGQLKDLLRILANRGIARILVEGGGAVHASFIEQGLADQAIAVIAPVIIGGKQAAIPVSGSGIAKVKDALHLKNLKIRQLGDNIIFEGSCQ
ncbi:MAG: bifunctional diaminohydroxyphosphoribosylaminopyrimidine deaminase/5-amino-6-(5-phosphoribosylamino)uracil reductase RibD [bacterium]|nr:bifunctional diaminohydroxyphosphoribosylaminopyrimidine deaminase/5-amino-6-(5-phosphoribosylamino)uracil reductase RibD [bacterium]